MLRPAHQFTSILFCASSQQGWLSLGSSIEAERVIIPLKLTEERILYCLCEGQSSWTLPWSFRWYRAMKRYKEHAGSLTIHEQFPDALAEALPQNMLSLKGEEWKWFRSAWMKTISRLDFDKLPGLNATVCVRTMQEVIGDASEADVVITDLFSTLSFDTSQLFAFNHDPQVSRRAKLSFSRKICWMSRCRKPWSQQRCLYLSIRSRCILTFKKKFINR